MTPRRFRHRLGWRTREATRRRGKVGSRTGIGDWSQLLDRDDVLILDTETTGLGPEAEVIEVALINTRGEELLHRLALPQGDIPRSATRIHGLTRSRLNQLGATGWHEVFAGLSPALQDATLVLVYNAAYDRRLLQQTCARHELRLPAVTWRCAMNDYAAWRRHRFGATSGHGLEPAFRRECGDSIDQQHRALSDCHMVLALMRAVTGHK